MIDKKKFESYLEELGQRYLHHVYEDLKPGMADFRYSYGCLDIIDLLLIRIRKGDFDVER